ncbi:MAG TPA: hypothetical protein VE865_13955 [Bradyrhizobium sp.]|nr:hypothetical protein [Bradyrhizobium sp.]
MPQTWYVTFEVHKRGTLPKRRSPRQTRRFQSEADARAFARMKVDEGLIVYAGTINPLLPRRSVRREEAAQYLATTGLAPQPKR